MYKQSLKNKVLNYLNQIKINSEEISKSENINKIKLMSDILYCTIRYLASPNNYKKFKFYELKANKRKTYITNGCSEKIINKYNDDKYRGIFEDKVLFAQKFNKFFKRGWLNINSMEYDEFKKFILDKEKVIYKPIDSAQANGIEVIKIKENENVEQIYKYLKGKPNGILEEWIVQHESVSKIYKNAVNCLRVITILENNKCNIVSAYLAMANANEIANLATGDLVSYIDLDNGTLNTDASNFSGKVFKEHPVSHVKIKGFQIPYWEEVCSMLKEASKVVPQVRYIGWDIAITPDGPLIIEGNTSPGYVYFQVPELLKDRIGIKENYKNFL